MKEKKSKLWLVLLALIVFCGLAVGNYLLGAFGENEQSTVQSTAVPTEIPTVEETPSDSVQLPTMATPKEATITAILKTDQGDITLELFADQVPKTVDNFVSLAGKDFYDQTVFHRVIKGFMIQGGCPNGDGTGGPGYRFDDEPFEGEYTRGTVAMANSGPNTNGSQFFIMHQDYPLPKNYVIFGRVTEGLEVVDKIAEAPTKMSASGENSVPLSPVALQDIEIIKD